MINLFFLLLVVTTIGPLGGLGVASGSRPLHASWKPICVLNCVCKVSIRPIDNQSFEVLTVHGNELLFWLSKAGFDEILAIKKSLLKLFTFNFII